MGETVVDANFFRIPPVRLADNFILKTIAVQRSNLVLQPDRKRVLLRPFLLPNEERAHTICAQVMALPESEVHTLWEQVRIEFGERHSKTHEFLQRRFAQVQHWLPSDQKISEERQLLLGAYFSHEYSLEAAALFNPSMVTHPDQSDLPPGAMRFILSLRATGEGHISSITFRTGFLDATGNITITTPTRYCLDPAQTPNLPAEKIIMLAQSDYEVQFADDSRLSERVLFPVTSAQSNGIEDARFVLFQDDDGTKTYYATYTAYDGRNILPQFIETVDFLRFKFITLNGPAVQNKGMALFPRKVNGQYVMLSRQDKENIYVMFSDHLHYWHTAQLIVKPKFAWEFIQMGNCGSPIETEAGWLVLSHGVGAMRKYSIGAFLLDLNDPTKVIGRLREPLITPNENEREGYVPNVVYSCGSLLRGRQLIIPYAMSDYATTFATLSLDEVLAAME